MTTDNQLELAAGDALTDHAEAIGIRRDKPIDTVAARLHAWALVATCGINCLRVGAVLYSWDTRPRLQKNGAALGRCYAQPTGQLTRDIGTYKIDAGGQVRLLPDELRELLPGGLEATAETFTPPGEAS